MKPGQILLSSALALSGGAVVSAAPAAAATLRTRCVGDAAGVTVPGDLVVPAGAACRLDGVTVQGAVTVRRGADLTLVNGASIGGNLTVASDGFADVGDSAIGGTVVGRDPFAVVLDRSRVGGDVTLNARPSAVDAFLYTLDSAVSGSLHATEAQVFVDSTTVDGAVETPNAVLTDLYDSSIAGALTVTGNELGSQVCETEIYGDARFEANSYGLRIGGPGAADGTCRGASYWGGDVTISNNTGDVIGIDVSDNIVRGSLTGDGNDPAPTGSGNRVRGQLGGQFVDLQPAAPTPTTAVAGASGSRASAIAGERGRRLLARRAVAAQKGTTVGRTALVPGV